MNHSPGSPPLDLSSTISPNDAASPAPCPFSLNLNLPPSNLEDSPAFSGELHSTSACEESSEDAPRSEGRPGLASGSASASASTLEEAPTSKHGREGRRKLGGTRGGGERGMNKSGNNMYKGVRKRKGGRWVSEIREPGKKTRIWLGTFATPEMAACAYDVAAYNLKTPYAYLNFPEYVSSLPIPASRSRKHIQEAAAAAAAAAALRGISNSSHVGHTGGLVATRTAQADETSTSSSPEKQEQQEQSTTVETKASSPLEEDMIFDMPNVLADMAEGLMITPPLHYLATTINEDHNTDCDRNAESSLWNL